MALFNVKILGADGVIKETTRQAADKFSLYRDVKKEGAQVIGVTEAAEKTSLNLSFLKNILNSVKFHDRIIFARNLGAMLEAGLSVSRALAVFERQTKSVALKEVVVSMSDGIRQGGTLHDAMAKFPNVFPPLFVAMVGAGEESGNLAENLRLIAAQMEKTYVLQKKIKGALIYPAIIVGIMIIIGALMLIYVVPALTKTFTELNVKLPLMTRVVMGLSDFLVSNILWVLLGVAAVGAGITMWVKTPKGSRVMDFLVLHMPVVGSLVKQTNAARTARTLSSLLSAGVPITEAIHITGDVIQNSYYREVLREAEKTVQTGDSLSGIFTKAENLYPPFVGEMMGVGEETGKLSDMFVRVAVFYEDEVDQKTKDMSTIIEPFLMVFIGITVGFFAVAMIAPTYALVDVIK